MTSEPLNCLSVRTACEHPRIGMSLEESNIHSCTADRAAGLIAAAYRDAVAKHGADVAFSVDIREEDDNVASV